MIRACRVRVLLTLTLGGCTVGPMYRPPTLPLAPSWRSTTTASPAANAWWIAFSDPVLNQLETEALSANLTIEQALARIDQSRGALRIAGAELLPSGLVDGTVARSEQSLNSGFGQLSRYVPTLNRTVNFAQFKLSGGWDLDLAGGKRRAHEGAHADAARAAAEFDAARLAVSADLADAYVALRGTQLQRLALRRVVALLEEQHRIMVVRVRVGAAPEEALQASAVTLEDAQALLPTLDAQIEADHNRIAVLLGRSPSLTVLDMADPGAVPAAPDPAAGIPADILRHRPDVVAAEQTLIAANAEIGATLAEYYPQLSLSALVGQESNTFVRFTSRNSRTAQGAVGLRWRLFDFARIDGEVQVARGRAREALAAYRDAVLRASADVETAFAALAAARSRVEHIVERRAAAEAVATSDERAFRTGELSRDEQINALRRVALIDADLALARQDAARAVVACDRALGAFTDSS